MTQRPFISFIVPVYNVEQYLCRCIDSILSQTCGDWELVLIDDGSRDASSRICDGYAEKDSRIKFIHQENRGVAVARNSGLNAASGEWVWFVDSDDWIEHGAVSFLKETCHSYSDNDLVMFGQIRHEGDHAVSHERKEMKDIGKNDFLRNQISFFNQCMIFRNDVIQEHGLRFTKGIRLAEDLEFQYKYEMLCLNPISISEPLYHYLIREGSATHSCRYRRNAVDDLYLVLHNLHGFIVKHGIASSVWLNIRLEMLMKNWLYSASLVERLDRQEYQKRVCEIVDIYRSIGFTCFENRKIRLAYSSVRLYFITNKIYLRIKGIS